MYISIHTNRETQECYVDPILRYGCEAWTIFKELQKKLEVTEMWFIWRILRISWTAKKSNETVLKEADITSSLLKRIRTRQATFFGHVVRREKLDCRTSCDNWNVRRETQQGKKAREDNGWTNKGAISRASDRYTKRVEGWRCVES